jgi:hypothetical protein
MNKGAKIFLAFGGAAAVIGFVAVASAKPKASAPPDVKPPLPVDEHPDSPPPGDGVVVVPDDDSQPPVIVPAPPATGVDVNEVARLLLRWWAAEGDSLFGSEIQNAAELGAQGFPRDWGSQTPDLGSIVTPRLTWMAKAFRFLVGGDSAPKLEQANGAIDQKLLDMLRKWAVSQALPPTTTPPLNTAPPPMVVLPPGSSAPPLLPSEPSPPQVVVLPPPSGGGGPTVPVVLPAPPSLPSSGPPPFVPPLPAAPVPSGDSQPVTPPAPAAQAPAVVPADTAALVQALLQAEASKGWKKIDAAVMAWQKSRGLKQDGKFGPKSALTVAAEIGTVPIIRYWPTGQYKEGPWLNQYRAALLELAAKATEPRASQLRHSAEREQGQGFGTSTAALPAALLINLSQVA